MCEQQQRILDIIKMSWVNPELGQSMEQKFRLEFLQRRRALKLRTKEGYNLRSSALAGPMNSEGAGGSGAMEVDGRGVPNQEVVA